jgi:hypothetical protein
MRIKRFSRAQPSTRSGRGKAVLEYGRESRWHLHYVAVLDPRDHDDHSGLVEMLGEKWVSLTEGCGYVYNCNAYPERYKYPVLGLVSLDHPETITSLHFLVSYMTLAGLFVKFDIQKKYHTFSKERFPKEALRKAGRPEERAPDSRLRITVAQARASFMNFIWTPALRRRRSRRSRWGSSC